jgi:ribosome biogenesis protein SSF1/2
MNNFQTTQPIADDNTKPAIPKHLESLTTSIFQSLFPPISPQNTPLTSIRRVMLLNRELPSGDNKSNPDDGSYILNLRHYAITTKRTGMSKSLRRLNAAEKLIKDKKNKKAMPNLGKLQDVSDYILDPSAAAGGFTSGSESEAETDAEVEVLENQTRQVLSRKKLEKMRKREQEQARSGPPVEKRAVKMVELGPRLKLRMTKVEEGVCGGKVMWHEFVNRTKAEEKELDERWDVRRKEKEERKRIQRENVERKRKERGEDVNEGEQDEEMDDDEDAWDSEDVENDDEEDEDEDEMDVDGPGKAKSG